MNTIEPGLIVPSADELERGWFRWKHWHPATAEDPRAAWTAGFKRSYELALEQLIGLETTLRRHLEVMQRLQDERSSEGRQEDLYQVGYRAALADSATFAGLVGTEQMLLAMLTEWRSELDYVRSLEELQTP